MKVELKHLAGYLPYELKCKTTHSKYKYKYKLIGLDFSGCIFKDFELFYFRIKPILRPLSDLTKEIEEDFNVYTTLSLRSKNDYDSGNPLILKWSYEDIQKLLEWHFDIYGLIEKGLAIDINTINK